MNLARQIRNFLRIFSHIPSLNVGHFRVGRSELGQNLLSRLGLDPYDPLEYFLILGRYARNPTNVKLLIARSNNINQLINK